MNEPRKRGPIARFFIGLWEAMNFTRRLILNLVFFALVLLVLAALGSGDRVKTLQDRTTLVIAPKGRLVEQFTCDPLSRQFMAQSAQDRCAEVQVRDVMRALKSAKTDKRIARVFLDLDELQPAGIATLRPIAAALADLRTANKQVIAFGEGYDQNNYLLAAQANEVYADPMGNGVPLIGFSSNKPYMRELLHDKLGVDVQVFKVGEFKSAVEPFVLDAASPEAKQADLYWMNDVWQRHLSDIAKARKLDAAQLAANIETLPEGVMAAQGDMAKYALQQKLIDGLKTREDVEDELAKRGAADDSAEGGFRQVSLDGYLKHIDGSLSSKVDERPQVAVVVAEGEILDGEQPPGTIGGESTAALLRDARDDDNVKAVVLRVNSPGGSAFASELIGREVVKLKAAGKPVVVSMGHLAASGGYWISMNADRIYADASTITGSIGVFGMVPTIPRTLEKIGIHTDGVATSRYAGAFDLTKPMDPQVGQVIQAGVDKIYRDFTSKVAQGRKQPVAAIDAIARGRVWSGQQALQRGLVDELGGLDAALADAAKRAKLKPDAYRVNYMEESLTPFAKWLGNFASTRLGAHVFGDSAVLRGLIARELPQLDARLRMLQSALSDGRGGPVKTIAYCFCDL